MADDKPFIPEFGPNGAVMNSPTMTDAMRKEIVEGDKRPLRRREPMGWRILGLFTVLLFVPNLFTIWHGDDAFGEFAWLKPWAAGLFVIMCLAIALRACWLVLMRWELVGPHRGLAAHRLRLPGTMRVAFAANEMSAVAAFVALSAGFVIFEAWAPDTGGWAGWGIAGLLTFLAVALGVAGSLRTFANHRGWVWREPDPDTGPAIDGGSRD